MTAVAIYGERQQDMGQIESDQGKYWTIKKLTIPYFFKYSGQGVCINECLTCSLIQMGSSLAYGDNSCPQCGASTTKVYLG